jgi:hopene-associated glycosyltransferase HpnB
MAGPAGFDLMHVDLRYIAGTVPGYNSSRLSPACGVADDTMVLEIIALIPLPVWCYLAIGHGGFWRCVERDGDHYPPSQRPRVAIVIPARDEADCIGRCLESLFGQDYDGPFRVVVVDDNSSDGTAAVARRTACDCHAEDRLTIVPGAPLSPGWTGKLWALRQGIAAAVDDGGEAPEFLLLTDADIVYVPTVLSFLVAHAEKRADVLTSLMVKLNCDSLAERFLIPAFIFFFQMLYPFAWVNRRDRATAAAAGGCMLIRAEALRRVGGIEVIRDALIDDCALAKRLKAEGPIWLGLTTRVTSIRSYPQWRDIAAMVSRSAYAQLDYSPLRLAGTVAAMALVYLVPPVVAFTASGIAFLFGASAFALMAILYQPVLRLYQLSPLWGLALPAVAFAYVVFTIESALASRRGQGGLWKGRFQAARAK